MAALLLIGLVGAVLVLYVAERFLKARRRGLRLRRMSDRLDAAASRAQHQHERREAAAEASAALTSFMPAIKGPPLTVPGTEVQVAQAAEPAEATGDCDGTGRPDHDRGHRGSRTGEQRPHTGEQRVRSGEHGPRSGEHPVRSGEHPVGSDEHPVRPGEHSARSGEHAVRSGEHGARSGEHGGRSRAH
jgi:hypothetical protein